MSLHSPPLLPESVRVENSFIPVDGVGEQTERSIWKQGVTHWDEFEPGVVGGKRGDRIDQFITEGRGHLDAADVAYFDRQFPSSEQWRLYETFDDRACFFDIETTGLANARRRRRPHRREFAGGLRRRGPAGDVQRQALRRAFSGGEL